MFTVLLFAGSSSGPGVRKRRSDRLFGLVMPSRPIASQASRVYAFPPSRKRKTLVWPSTCYSAFVSGTGAAAKIGRARWHRLSVVSGRRLRRRRVAR